MSDPRRVLPFIALLFSAAGIGCGNFTNFTTARSLDAGEGRFDTVVAEAGAAFALDIRTRAGLGYGLEGGVSFGYSGLLNGDLKYQFLQQRDDPSPATPRRGGAKRAPGNAPVNASVGVGAGDGVFAKHGYAQLTVSRRFNSFFEPYFAYRYQVINLKIDLGDPDDVDDTNNTIFEDLVSNAHGSHLYIHHFFFGAEVDLGRKFYMTPEFSFVAGDATGIGDVGVAFGYRW